MTLKGHTGPVWKLSWAHPTNYGRVLASCGYDKRVIIWRQMDSNNGQKWQKWFVDQFKSSVNTVQFAPSTPNNNNTLELIAGCSDGTIKIYTLNQSYINDIFLRFCED